VFEGGALYLLCFLCVLLTSDIALRFITFISLSPLSNHQCFVGVLLTTQPEFITGIEDASEARSNAFGAMGMFIGTFAFSLYGIMRTSSNEKEEIDTGSEGYQLTGVGAEYATSRYD